VSKKRKIILSVLLSTAAVIGITAGVAFADDENDSSAPPEARHEALLERVCEIYENNTGVAIEPEALSEAFAEANQAMMAEAREARLAKLVEDGVITQEEADQFSEWWEARPEGVLPGGGQFGPGPGGPGCGGPGMGRHFGPAMGDPNFPGGPGDGDGAA
jgi:hypothetical protein